MTSLAAPPSNVNITDSGLTANTVAVSASTTLTCSAAGTHPLQYIWYHNTTPLPGANSNTYTVYSAAFSDVGEYTCEVSNWAGKSSGTYTLNVQSKYVAVDVTYMSHACTASMHACSSEQLIIILHADARATNIWYIYIYTVRTYVYTCVCCAWYILTHGIDHV